MEVLDNIYNIYKNQYKCMNDQSHESSLFCIICNNFLCDNCIKGHDSNHNTIK